MVPLYVSSVDSRFDLHLFFPPPPLIHFLSPPFLLSKNNTTPKKKKKKNLQQNNHVHWTQRFPGRIVSTGRRSTTGNPEQVRVSKTARLEHFWSILEEPTTPGFTITVQLQPRTRISSVLGSVWKD